ncbi:MAG: hypothetical protein ACT4TC_04180 [Myxococcaceae bacterium]
MRTRLTAIFTAAVAASVLTAAAPAAPRDRGPDAIDVSDYPPKYRDLYKLVETRCSKCHSFSRVVSARLKPDDWKLYVKKMSRRQGSGISPEVGDKIYEFLKYRTERKVKAAAEKKD